MRVAQPGFLDLAGFEKPKYYYRQSLWSQEPMVHLSSISKENSSYENNNRWNISETHWNWKAEEQVEVICYTNCEEAELFLNDKSLGIKKLKDFPQYYLTWEVVFEVGELKVVAKNNDGKTCTYEIYSALNPKTLTMRVDDTELIANGQDMAHIEIEVIDDNGKLFYLAHNEINLTLEGPGEIIGMENGDPQDLEPYSSRKRKVYNGKLLVYIRTKTVVGQIVIKAESKGLEPARLVVNVK